MIASPQKDNFNQWLKKWHSSAWYWDWEWQLYVQDALAEVSAGTLRKLMLFLPPRHGKSEMLTVRYPIYRLACDPTQRIIVGAYNQILANKFSRKSRNVARQAGIKLNPHRYAVEDWETEEGGGLRAVGVGGGITGQGGNLIIIDDPVKNREEAESELYREKVYDWYSDDLYTRREPGAAIVLIMTRWHEDDLAGRILASEDGPNWRVISLPAEAEENDPLGRAVGEALCSERYDIEALHDLRRVLGNSYYALFQQRPQPKEGSMFKYHWFTYGLPASRHAYRVRYWDNAATEDDGDYSVGVLMSYEKDKFIIEDVVRGQWSAETREKIRLQKAEDDYARYGDNVEIWIEQETGSSGKEAAAAQIARLAGYRAYAEAVSGQKEIRAEPFAAQAEAGNVRMVEADWNDAYLKELTSFPLGKNDDQVDASSGAFNKLALKIRRPYEAAVAGSRDLINLYKVR